MLKVVLSASIVCQFSTDLPCHRQSYAACPCEGPDSIFPYFLQSDVMISNLNYRILQPMSCHFWDVNSVQSFWDLLITSSRKPSLRIFWTNIRAEVFLEIKTKFYTLSPIPMFLHSTGPQRPQGALGTTALHRITFYFSKTQHTNSQYIRQYHLAVHSCVKARWLAVRPLR